MRRTKHRHFLLHTIEHLFGAFSIFVIALLLGVASKSFNALPSGLLAQTSNSEVFPMESLTTTTQLVSFGAERKEIGCVSGMTMGKYHFTISPEGGGYIVVTTPTGVDNVYLGDSRGFDRNYEAGSYTWSGSARTGFVGTSFGAFTIENICTSGTSTSTNNDTQDLSPTTTVPSSEELLVGVSFSIQPGPSATCGATGSPLTPVFLVTTKATGGEFLVSSNTGMKNARFVWGEYYFPNGIYTWNAVVKSGFRGDGVLAGTFEINNECPVPVVSAEASMSTSVTATPVTAASSTATSAIETKTELPPLPRPQLHLFLDNIPTSDGRIFNKEQVEVRITTSIATNVDVFAVRGTAESELLGGAVKDDLLSRPGLDVWSYVADMKIFPEGASKLYVRVRHNDNRETLSERLTVSVKHPTLTTTRTIITTTPPPAAAKESGNASIETSVHVSEKDRTQVLERVSDPSSCSNAEECRIYCRSLPGVNDLCVSFAQEQFTPTLPVDESLAGDVPTAQLAELLDGGIKHAPEIPEYILLPGDFRQYCAQSANVPLCTKVLIESKFVDPAVLAQKVEFIARSEEERARVFVERIGTRNFVDTDTDGVTDYDEINFYHTDPANVDTDKDGFTDGTELLARTNPSGGVRVLSGFEPTTTPTVPAVTDESVLLESPKVAGPAMPKLLIVKNIEVAEVGKTNEGVPTAKKLKLAGVAMPNAFVTLYIFSEPIVVTVKADEAGAWVYTLDRELSDGTHEVYSTITDAGGRILAKSDPLPFVKVAAAVSLGEESLVSVESAPGFFTGPSLYAMIAVLIGVLGVALSLIGFIVKQRASDAADLPGI